MHFQWSWFLTRFMASLAEEVSGPLPPPPHAHRHMCTDTCTQAHCNTHVREGMPRLYTRIRARAHTHTHTYAHIHVHTHMYTYTHAHMYTYAHTHKANGYLSWRIQMNRKIDPKALMAWVSTRSVSTIGHTSLSPSPPPLSHSRTRALFLLGADIDQTVQTMCIEGVLSL